MRERKAQVTVFIIIGVVLVAAVIIFFMLYRQGGGISAPSITEPQQYIEKCTRDVASDAIEIMLPQGGFIEPKTFKLYNNNKVAYLCYNHFYYQRCIMQVPLYIQHLESEITNYITPKVETCFQNLKSDLEKKNYNIGLGEMNITTTLLKDTVKIKIDRILDMSRNEEKRRFDSYKTTFNSPLYNLASVAHEIANQEAKYCYFDYIGYMVLYPKFSIDRKSVGQGLSTSRIYTVEDRYSGKKLWIAVRSCAIPSGFG